jgi:hypothetical protein
MKKSTSRSLYLIGLVAIIVATVLFALGAAHSTVDSATGAVTSVGNPGLVTAGVGVYIVGSILLLIAWIGALVKTAQLGRWGWFVCLLLLSGLTMLIYIFGGPTTPASSPQAQYSYPQNPQYPQR